MKLRLSYIRLFRIATLFVFAACSASQTSAKCPGTPYEAGVVASPSRPAYASSADILQEGVVEFEYGYSHSWVNAETFQSDLPGTLRFAVSCNLEIRIGSDNLMQVNQNGQTQRGFGDTWLSTQYEFWRATKNTPALAFAYGVKLPNASVEKGLGTGKYDQTYTFLVNRNVGNTALTFNAVFNEVGRAGSQGFDRNTLLAGNFVRPVNGKLGMTGELYSATRLNPATPGYTGTLWALTYTKNPRLVFDAGVDLALTGRISHQRTFVGFSYAIGELYPSLRPRPKRVQE